MDRTYRARLPGLRPDLYVTDMELPEPVLTSDPEQANVTRAVWAGRALLAYIVAAGGATIEGGVACLLGDLRHLCDAAGVDYEVQMMRAMENYGAEIYGE